MTITSSQKHYARFGRCQNIETGATRCAMSPDDCEPAINEEGEIWISNLRLAQKGINEAPCKCENTLMGACVSVGGKHMTYECAPRTKSVEEDYCRKPSDGKIDPIYDILPANTAGTNCYCDALQSIEDDSIRKSSSSRTKYGACYNPSSVSDNFFCAYSSEYCTGEHVWIHPEDVPSIRDSGEHCTCESTHIGGCVGGMYSFHCALSEYDCQWNRFVLPFALKQEHNHACFLCEQTMKLNPNPDEIDMTAFKGTTGLSTGAAISVGVAVSVVGLVLLGAVRFLMVGKKSKAVTKQKHVEEDHEESYTNGESDVGSEEEDSVPESTPVDKDSFVIS